MDLDPIASTAVHPAGGVLATCSGQKQYPSSPEGSTDELGFVGRTARQVDNSLRIWALT